jgi:ABC-type transport system involved in cytochrome bd biosynthesis fused ATPase/permease subunit
VEIGLRLLAGHVGYQTALLVLLLTPEAYLPLRNAGAEFHASTEGSAAAERAFEILDIPAPAPTDPQLAGAADLGREDIVVRAVSLGYPGRDRPALDDINLTIRPGEHILLTGPSGAGKSSLLALLLGFVAPGSGTLVAGDTDLARIPADRWLPQIAWVPQHPHLFATTVARNIALGQPGAEQPQIAAAARLAGADDFIRRLPRGYDTVLTEGGATCRPGSGRDRPGPGVPARAPVLLLDEPTRTSTRPAPDLVATAIETQMADRTVVIVTHRPRSTGHRRRILLLEQGRLYGRTAGAGRRTIRAGLAAAP